MFSTVLRTAVTRLLLVCSGLLSAGSLTTHAAEPLRLHEIIVSRFDVLNETQIGEARVLYTELGISHVQGYAAPIPLETVPAEWRGKPLLPATSVLAYFWLSEQALENFVVDFETPLTFAERRFYPVAASEAAKLSYGRPMNLSTRGLIETGRPLIGGFVVEGPARWFLIRALGPSLRPAGVTDAIENPFLTLYKGNLGLYLNDDWGTRHDADAIESISAQVGASPLSRTGKEAALLVELTTGSYSVHVQSASNQERGEAMFEIFIVDEP